ncbi:Myblike DNAbinding domain-containing protein [Boothiomyces sp. JEL0866]|nr:Myblike DNAbinding domain-containing protein [Boothiomyces sp. JEL0866]
MSTENEINQLLPQKLSDILQTDIKITDPFKEDHMQQIQQVAQNQAIQIQQQQLQQQQIQQQQMQQQLIQQQMQQQSIQQLQIEINPTIPIVNTNLELKDSSDSPHNPFKPVDQVRSDLVKEQPPEKKDPLLSVFGNPVDNNPFALETPDPNQNNPFVLEKSDPNQNNPFVQKEQPNNPFVQTPVKIERTKSINSIVSPAEPPTFEQLQKQFNDTQTDLAFMKRNVEQSQALFQQKLRIIQDEFEKQKQEWLDKLQGFQDVINVKDKEIQTLELKLKDTNKQLDLVNAYVAKKVVAQASQNEDLLASYTPNLQKEMSINTNQINTIPNNSPGNNSPALSQMHLMNRTAIHEPVILNQPIIGMQYDINNQAPPANVALHLQAQMQFPNNFIPPVQGNNYMYSMTNQFPPQNLIHPFEEKEITPPPFKKQKTEEQEWTAQDNQLLIETVEQVGQKWTEVAQKLNRTPQQCQQHYVNICPRKGKWSKQEDQQLLAAYKTLYEQEMAANNGTAPNTQVTTFWYKVAESIVGRSGQQCMARYNETLDPSVKKGKWSAEEDELLQNGFQQYGKSWVKLSSLIPGRTQRQCRTRWIQLSKDDKLIKTKIVETEIIPGSPSSFDEDSDCYDEDVDNE